MPLALDPARKLGDRFLAGIAKFAATTMAKRFIAGSTPDEAFVTVRKLREKALAFTADLLGRGRHQRVRGRRLSEDLPRPPPRPRRAAECRRPRSRSSTATTTAPIPRVNLSLKLTSLTTQFDALHAETTTERVLARLRPILRTAREVGAFVNVDMEQYAHKDLTYAIFKRGPRPSRSSATGRTPASSARRICPRRWRDLDDAPRLGRDARRRRSRSGW